MTNDHICFKQCIREFAAVQLWAVLTQAYHLTWALYAVRDAASTASEAVAGVKIILLWAWRDAVVTQSLPSKCWDHICRLVLVPAAPPPFQLPDCDLRKQ